MIDCFLSRALFLIYIETLFLLDIIAKNGLYEDASAFCHVVLGRSFCGVLFRIIGKLIDLVSQ